MRERGPTVTGCAHAFGPVIFSWWEDAMTETDAYIESLRVTYPLVEPVHRAAIQALQLPAGSHGLDAGCGIGLPALLLAEAVGPAGHVTGLDLSPEHLACAREVVARAGLSERISFQEGDVRELPFDDGTFDWAWSSDCVGYGPQLGPLSLVRELARVLKPGGSVAILAWSSQVLLPGFPLLEAHLNATSSGLAPFASGYRPESHFLRALGWFRDVGLEELSAQTFAGDAHAPLSGELRAALTALFEMRWPGVEPELAEQDREAYRRLCLPDSPDFIVDHPDYYAFFTYSMFRGRVPGCGAQAVGGAGDPR
jgi:demethylmenaquinone methyltransferase/2-methoxy-6-polyprenyl-1,4-benzoquinol methylase